MSAQTIERKIKGFWQNSSHQRKTLDNIGKNLGVVQWKDWYSIKRKQVKNENGGNLLLKQYNNSFSRMLIGIYPEYEWRQSEFKQVPTGFWMNTQNQREFMDDLFSEMRMNSWQDWYQVTQKDLLLHGAGSILKYYKHSPSELIRSIYSERDWQQWKFKSVGTKFWKEGDLGDYFKWSQQQLGIIKIEDWSRVSRQQFRSVKGSSLLLRYGSMSGVLQRLLPDYQTLKLRKSMLQSIVLPSKSQHHLCRLVKSLLPHISSKIYMDCPVSPKMRFSSSNVQMQFDIFVAPLSLVFEYQGIQHYRDHYLFGRSEELIARDLEKRSTCLKNGFFFVEVPFTWDQSKGRLLQLIKEQCPANIFDQFTNDSHHRGRLLLNEPSRWRIGET